MAMTTSKTGYRIGYANLPPGVFIAPFPDVRLDGDPEALAAEVERCLGALRTLLATQTAPADTAAIVLEPVIGEGGYLPCPPAFLRGIADLCREVGMLFVADEVQTGFGRTGTMFAVEHFGVEPDVLMMAKGIASGFPLERARCVRRPDGAVAGRLARRHLRRQPDRLRGGARHDRRARRRWLPRRRRGAGRATARRAAPGRRRRRRRDRAHARASA